MRSRRTGERFCSSRLFRLMMTGTMFSMKAFFWTCGLKAAPPQWPSVTRKPPAIIFDSASGAHLRHHLLLRRLHHSLDHGGRVLLLLRLPPSRRRRRNGLQLHLLQAQDFERLRQDFGPVDVQREVLVCEERWDTGEILVFGQYGAMLADSQIRTNKMS